MHVPRSLQYFDPTLTLKRSWAEAFEVLASYKLPIKWSSSPQVAPCARSPIKSVVRKLNFNYPFPEPCVVEEIAPATFSASSRATRKLRGCKAKPLLVAPPNYFSNSRMTRSVAKLKGYKPTSTIPLKAKPLRQPRAKKMKLSYEPKVVEITVGNNTEQ